MVEQYYIGFDIGGTKVSAGLVDSQDRILIQKKYATPPNAAEKDILHSISSIINELINEQNISLNKIAGIGFGVPGIVDKHGTIVVTPNLNLDGFALKEAVKKMYGCKVEVGNDVNVGLLGEKWFGAGQGYSDIIGIFPGTGLGGAVMINGKFISGINGAAAEIGHMIIKPDGEPCGCGNKGCLEAYTGRWAIERDIRKAIKKGQDSIVPSLLKNSEDQIKSSHIAKGWQKDDAVTQKVMKEVCRTLGETCISLRHIFDPELFVFGGGVIEACGEWMLPLIDQELRKDPFFAKFPACPIIESQLADDAIILGAVALVSGGLKPSRRSRNLYYPWVSLNNENQIIVNGRIKKSSFSIRANGRIKKHKIKANKGLNLRPLLKRNPDIVFIGTDQEGLLSAEDQNRAAEAKVELIVLPKKDAVDKYNASRKLKALLIS